MKNYLFFCMIIVAKSAFAQEMAYKYSPGFATSLSLRLVPVKNIFDVKTILPENFYAKNLGFFCKQELKFEALTKIPFKFRLGSVEYCDKMEGKGNGGIWNRE